MKKSDFAMIIFIASISILVAYFVAKALIGNTNTQAVTVKTATPISSQVATPDPAVFNKSAINPTVQVEIGGGTSTSPIFQGTQ